MFSGKVKESGDAGLCCLVLCFFQKKKYSCWSAMGNLNQFFFFFFKEGLICELVHLKEKEKSAKVGGGERERAWPIHFTTDISSQTVLRHRKPRPCSTVNSSRKVPFGWTSSWCPQADTHAFPGTDPSLGSGREETPQSYPIFVVIATLWITKDIGLHQTSISVWLFMASALWQWIAEFLTKRILVCSATPHFSPHSSFMILMRVFFQETHISLFDLGASVRIFFFNTTLAFWKC